VCGVLRHPPPLLVISHGAQCTRGVLPTVRSRKELLKGILIELNSSSSSSPLTLLAFSALFAPMNNCWSRLAARPGSLLRIIGHSLNQVEWNCERWIEVLAPLHLPCDAMFLMLVTSGLRMFA